MTMLHDSTAPAPPSEETKSNLNISKIMIWPSRTLNLGAQGYAKLSAGVEVEIDPAIDINDTKQIAEAFEKAGKIVNEEMRRQYKPYIKYFKK